LDVWHAAVFLVEELLVGVDAVEVGLPATTPTPAMSVCGRDEALAGDP
jgi:hypothetical protein